MEIIKERNGFALILVDSLYYVVRIDRNAGQVKSALHRDMPRGGGEWFARLTSNGVKYVAGGMTRERGLANFNRISKD